MLCYVKLIAAKSRKLNAHVCVCMYQLADMIHSLGLVVLVVASVVADLPPAPIIDHYGGSSTKNCYKVLTIHVY